MTHLISSDAPGAPAELHGDAAVSSARFLPLSVCSMVHSVTVLLMAAAEPATF